MVMGERSETMEDNNGKAGLAYLCFSLLFCQGISPVLFFFSHFYMVWWEISKDPGLRRGNQQSHRSEWYYIGCKKTARACVPRSAPTTYLEPAKPWLRAHRSGEPEQTKESGKIVFRVFYDLHTASPNVNILHNDGTFIKIKKLASTQ